MIGKGSQTITERLAESLQQLTNMEVYINFYADKRKREFDLDSSSQLALWDMLVAHAGSQAGDTTTSKMGSPGIVGGVALSRLRPCLRGRGKSVGSNDGQDESDLAIRSYRAESLREAVESAIGQRAVAFSTSWLGTGIRHVPRPTDSQLPLFDL